MQATPWMATAAMLLALLALPCAGSGAGELAALQWLRFEDPLQHAFSVEVPRGWVVRGGMFRLGPADLRLMLDLTSPDGRINVRLGDVFVPGYIIPGALHGSEGTWLTQGVQPPRIVARYRTGAQFAVLYSHARFARLCPRPQADSHSADFIMPEYVAALADEGSSGQIAYRCEGAQQSHTGFVFTRTRQEGERWGVPVLASFFATVEESARARAVLLHAVRSYQTLTPLASEGPPAGASPWMSRSPRLQQLWRALADYLRRRPLPGPADQIAPAALAGVELSSIPLSAPLQLPWPGLEPHYWTNGTGQVVNSAAAPSIAWHALSVQAP